MTTPPSKLKIMAELSSAMEALAVGFEAEGAHKDAAVVRDGGPAVVAAMAEFAATHGVGSVLTLLRTVEAMQARRDV